ncbi:MAG: glycine/sarcosine/betaine reductase complex component C subunit alpha [Thermanaerothrix sp.]|nr:glycine/sarcosine/betaine reductase complex component C subunit alpha [Thermanaerothrix sp.]
MRHKEMVAEALEEIISLARGQVRKPVRIGLMARGNEVGVQELLMGARRAMREDGALKVVMVGPRVEGFEDLEWIETQDCEEAVSSALEKGLSDSGDLDGAVALHYPFPFGVTTVGMVVTPGRGRPMLISSTTGTASADRVEAMVLNGVLGRAVARCLGIEDPSLGVLNVEGAASAVRALGRLRDGGYPIRFGSSLRSDGGALLRGNDILAGAVDVCICDSLTGNVLNKVFSAFTTGGAYEALGWGYGPSVGIGWGRVISIISRASGEPVVAGAIAYTAKMVRGCLPKVVEQEVALAKGAGLEAILEGLRGSAPVQSDVKCPPKEPTDEEISGVDVLEVEAAARVLWREGIYAESAMGCTGPVIKLPSRHHARALELLRSAGYI